MASALRADAYLAAYASTDPAVTVHATVVGRAPRALCGALVDRLHHCARLGGEPSFDLHLGTGCPDCVTAIIADLAPLPPGLAAVP